MQQMLRVIGVAVMISVISGVSMASPVGSHSGIGAHHGPWHGPGHLKPWHNNLYGHRARPGWYRLCTYERGPASPYGAIAEAVEHGVAGVETGEVKAVCSNGYWYGRTGGWYYPGYGQPLDPALGWPVVGDPGAFGPLPQLDFYPD